ncbi:MAG: PaaI family thioesterase [Rhodobacteraceae bacterium]|nr:MAG: PaaI family thioesterase [Paracoccaceae bacterium]
MTSEPVLSVLEVQTFLATEFPQVSADYDVLEVGPMRARIAMKPGERHLRPGGTISGPTMFALADCAVYLAIIAHVGSEALAVTTTASMDFMRKPVAGVPLVADVTLLKLGRGLAVGDVHILSDDILVARATLTYSRPRAVAG